jgi:hypothetical protein
MSTMKQKRSERILARKLALEYDEAELEQVRGGNSKAASKAAVAASSCTWQSSIDCYPVGDCQDYDV